jgi:DNA replication licensing factor MCM6
VHLFGVGATFNRQLFRDSHIVILPSVLLTLLTFNSRQEVQSEEDVDDEENPDAEKEVSYIHPYAEQADQMARHQLSRRSSNPEETQGASGGSGFANTLFLNFLHVMRHDPELADAIKGEFCRFEPFLRKAVQSFVLDLHPELDDPSASASSSAHNAASYFMAVHNLPATYSIRRLRTDFIGALSSVTGTVTRTSDVRPELLVASFRCNKCGLLAAKIPQQYHYTRPTLCRNPRCKNRSPQQFTLEIRQSEFVDWQKLRVQENSNQIPPGSMPRSMDIIVRNEMVERAKAGDKCVFTGSLVVIPDGSALARAGEAAQATKKRGGGRPSDAASGGGGGVRGLSALGVRELTYRTCFVASSVLPADSLQQANNNEQVVASFLFGKATLENHEPTTDEVAMEFTEAQRAEIRAMRASPRLYEQVSVDSLRVR